MLSFWVSRGGERSKISFFSFYQKLRRIEKSVLSKKKFYFYSGHVEKKVVSIFYFVDFKHKKSSIIRGGETQNKKTLKINYVWNIIYSFEGEEGQKSVFSVFIKNYAESKKKMF